MTRSEFATRVGAPESSVKYWGQPGGLLHGRPYGLYTETDAAVCLVYIEVQKLCGEKSPRALQIAKQLSPTVGATMLASTKQITANIQISDATSVKLTIDLSLLLGG